MQIMPETAADIAKQMGVTSYDIKDPETNIKFGIWYLDSLYTQLYSTYGWEGVVAAYNAGPGAVNKYKGIPPYAETKNYVNNVIGYYNTIK